MAFFPNPFVSFVNHSAFSISLPDLGKWHSLIAGTNHSALAYAGAGKEELSPFLCSTCNENRYVPIKEQILHKSRTDFGEDE